jgi:ABC-type uncharacterized transport system substrate-binding protein
MLGVVNSASMLLFVSAFFLLITNSAWANSVFIVHSNDNTLNQQATDLIVQKTRSLNSKINIELISVDALKNKQLNQDDLLVSVGNDTANTLQGRVLDSPIIYSFSSQSALPKTEGNWLATVIEQPLERLLAIAPQLIKHDYKKQILLPFSSENITPIKHLINDTLSTSLKLVEVLAHEKPAKKIDPFLFKSGALIAINDKNIWSGENARWILIQAYKNNVPVIGFSQKFLKAGALVVVYSSLEQIADTTAESINNWYTNNQLPPKNILYSNYNIEYNRKIARTLKINVPDNMMNVESEK